ncbi:type II secretion system (T2SS) protein M subtype b [Hoeflea marina]|uniref:Type II secretion system (T2SS) protein M subtype b n=1 Tax=Hoeflea marina TaxID=274592 RepID=A0A317PL30_9HYPH|nr:type II secretion system protein GspM [Hoeflea marina]PWW01506.1 type II secretion system (T2SS) protein M subtype b [Hoeflea marina]
MIDAAFSALLNLPKLTQQLVAVAMLLLGALVSVGLISAGAGHLQSQRDSIQTLRKQAGVLEAIVAQRPFLQTASAEEGQQSGLAGQMLQGENAALARAALQSRFSALAQGHRVEVVSVANARDLDIGGLIYLGLAVSLQGPMHELHATVMDLETSSPQLFLQDVAVRAIHASRADDGMAAPETELTLQFKIYGLFLARAEDRSAPDAVVAEPVAGQ